MVKRIKWKQHTKNGRTFMRPNIMTCPYVIEVNQTRGKHIIYDIRMYSNGGSTSYQKIGESFSLAMAQNILRNAYKQEQTI
jgi:hypothetical protein